MAFILDVLPFPAFHVACQIERERKLKRRGQIEVLGPPSL
jgi:hypothetical protein